MARSSPHVAKAERYAREVVAGKIPGCKWTVLACKRHLDDLERSKRKDWPYKFDRDRAQDICTFAELFPHVKGKWARGVAGDPDSKRIRLEPWQCFILASLYGWVHKATGFRRFREGYVEVPRKNGKSVLAAVIALYMLAADEEEGAEVYSGATSEKQAWEVFRPAKQMTDKTPDYREAFGVESAAKSIFVESNGSRCEPVIGKPGDGASPSCAIVDEYHEHDTDELYATMLTGMGARDQPLILAITTAGDNLAGPCKAMHDEVEQTLDGRVEADQLFGIIYSTDDDDDPFTDLALRKANPNIGVSVSWDFLRAQQRDAKLSPRKLGRFLTKHLNRWVNALTGWMNMQAWKACGDPMLKLEDFLGGPCLVGVDLANKIDIAAKVRVFPRDLEFERDGKKTTERHYYVFGRYYVPQARVDDPRNEHYRTWVEQGRLVATDGDVTDHGVIEGDLLDDRVFGIVEVAYDPWSATGFAVRMQTEGLPMVEVPQNVRHLSEPMKQLEALTISQRLHHDGDPVLEWMMSNVVAKEDAKGNIFPRKPQDPRKKIDGAAALITVLSRALVQKEPEAEPEYFVEL